MKTEESWQELARETIESLHATLIENGMEHLIPSEKEFEQRAKKKLARIKRQIKTWERLGKCNL